MPENDKISRREMLKKLGQWGVVGAVAATGAAGAIKVITEADKILSRPSLELIPTPEPEKPTLAPQPTENIKPPSIIIENDSPAPDRLSRKEFVMNFGEEKRVELDLDWAPDTHTSMLKHYGKFLVFLSGRRESYRIETDNLEIMSNPLQILAPDFSENKGGTIEYTGTGSVIPGANTNELIMFYHQETWGNHNGQNFRADICLAVSKDNGFTWEKKETIIEGKKPAIPGKRTSGAGQPCAITFKNEVFVFYVDWNAVDGFDAIHVAKTKIETVNNPNTWQKFNGRDFGAPGITDQSTAVISPAVDREKLAYCALPDVSYNQYLNRWLALFETMDGFYTCTSADLLHWENYQNVFPFPKPRDKQERGDNWFSYPTLISPDCSSDRITDQNGILIYSKGQFEKTPHNMYFSPFRLT